MSAAEDKLSPEEKLLRVIQGGKKDVDDDVPEAVSPAAETISAAEPVETAAFEMHEADETLSVKAAAEERASPEEMPAGAPPKLKLADQADLGDEVLDASEFPEAASEDKEQTVAVAVVPEELAKRKRFAPTYGINVANKVLAIAILVVLLLTGFEIWSQVKAGQTMTSPKMIEMEQRVADAALPDLTTLLKAFRDRALFAVIERAEPIASPNRPDNVTKGLSLLGLSKNDEGDQEVILMDDKTHMYFLREGDDFEANGTKLIVARIESESVVFRDDWEREWTLKH